MYGGGYRPYQSSAPVQCAAAVTMPLSAVTAVAFRIVSGRLSTELLMAKRKLNC